MENLNNCFSCIRRSAIDVYRAHRFDSKIALYIFMNPLGCLWFIRRSFLYLLFKLNHLYKNSLYYDGIHELVRPFVRSSVRSFVRSFAHHQQNPQQRMTITIWLLHFERVCVTKYIEMKFVFISKTSSFRRLQTTIATKTEYSLLNQLHNSLAMAKVAWISVNISRVWWAI